MADLAELIESALHALSEGVALADNRGNVAFWNASAAGITGWAASETIGRDARHVLRDVVVSDRPHRTPHTEAAEPSNERGGVIQIRHKLGMEFPVAARTLVLRDQLGKRFGTGVLFHPLEKIDALPNGETGRGWDSGQSRIELEDRLARVHEDFRNDDNPFGVLWVTVDQAPALRRTHGKGACEAMLESIERTLGSGLKPAEEIGRWGDQDFLILSHERSSAALTAHGQSLAGLARTADFRWWGDRVTLTVSIGAAQAIKDESLCTLLDRAEGAMLASIYAGGNQTTAARENE